MNGPEILSIYQHELASAIIKRGGDYPRFRPLPISPWVAMSLLQKAIRRGRTELALQAAATLLTGSQQRFWRRLGIIAYEDIGIANLDLAGKVVAGLSGKRWRAQLGGEWAVASYLVEELCRSVKCRASDDLIITADWHPGYAEYRQSLKGKSLTDLLQKVAKHCPKIEQVLALWFAIGTDKCRSHSLPNVKGDPTALFDHLCEIGFPHSVVEMARIGFRKTGSLLCPATVLLSQEKAFESGAVKPDTIPEEVMIGDVACWAYDMHVREGNAAIKHLLDIECETAKWTKAHITKNKVAFLGGILFCIESGLVDRRLCWPIGDSLLYQASIECHEVPAHQAEEISEILLHDLPRLNECRRSVLMRGK